LAAERALRQKPWRPWVIRFSGEKERSGWDWADLLLKISVPVLILALSTAYSTISSSRQEKIAQEQRESDVITNSFKEMQSLILDKDLKKSDSGTEVRGVARGITLAALSQVQDPKRKRSIVSFLLDSGLNAEPWNLFSLDEANLRFADLRDAKLSGANLRFANLSGANLWFADLRSADLRDAKLSEADLWRANLRFADLRFADLREAKLSGANLAGADLTYAYLDGADLRGANLWRANLRPALFNQTICPDGKKTDTKCPVPKASR